MNKVSKKEISAKLIEAMNQALVQLDIAPPSKKTKKLVVKATKKISQRLKQQIKKRIKKEEKAAKLSAKNGKVSEKPAKFSKEIEKLQ